jgi:hypothetical protein
MAREEFFRKLYHRLHGQGRRLCVCTKCGAKLNIAAGLVSSEPCWECEAVAWREFTEEEFASATRRSELPTLHSEYLASELKSLDDEDVEPDEWTRVYRELVECIEGFGDEQMAAWLRLNLEKHPKILEYVLDEFYTRDFLKKVRKIVERTMLLKAMGAKAKPEGGVNLYLREAARCYVFGFWDSSVALSRAAVERALKDRLKEKLGNNMPIGDDGLMKRLLDYAYKMRLIDGAHLTMGEKVRIAGNKVLHGAHARENDAGESLATARGVLSQLYSRT